MIDKDAIKARLADATPGPWKKVSQEASYEVGVFEIFGVDPIASISEFSSTGSDYITALESMEENDAEFIAHAPTDIADLLAEVERLECELGKFKPCICGEGHYIKEGTENE